MTGFFFDCALRPGEASWLDAALRHPTPRQTAMRRYPM
jgi:hypothetical protein